MPRYRSSEPRTIHLSVQLTKTEKDKIKRFMFLSGSHSMVDAITLAIDRGIAAYNVGTYQVTDAKGTRTASWSELREHGLSEVIRSLEVHEVVKIVKAVASLHTDEEGNTYAGDTVQSSIRIERLS